MTKRNAQYAVTALVIIVALQAAVCNAQIEISDDTAWLLADSPVALTCSVSVLPGVQLSIEPGVTVEASSNGQIAVYGTIVAGGTEMQPVTFTRSGTDGTWPGIAILGDRIFDALTATGTFEYCVIEHAAAPSVYPYELTAALSARFSVVSVSNCTFRDIDNTVILPTDSRVDIRDSTFLRCGEGINVVRCDARLTGNYLHLIRNGADAIDVDLEWSGLGWKPALVAGNVISGGSGDGIDLGGSAATVSGNLIVNCADKGISIGEGSNGRIENNVILYCRLGMAVKDSSAPIIANNTILGCRVGISSYEKSFGMGGARGHVVNTIVQHCEESISLDDLSLLDIRHSLVHERFVWPGTGNSTNDPSFVDPFSANVLLQPGSAALGAGTAVRGATNDYHGASRGAPPAVGAFDNSLESFDSDGDGIADSGDEFPFHREWSVDSDTDGLPDQWELMYFGGLSEVSPGDSDGDGINNRDEFLSGLSPTNAERNVVINEIMYNPDGPGATNEFVELYNCGTTTVDLAGWQLTDEVLFNFTNGTKLAPGGYLVVAGYPSEVEVLYGITSVQGPWAGELLDGDAVVRLVGPTQADIDTVEYRNHGDWPVGADGGGSSLELTRPQADNNDGSAWAASAVAGGTPGRRNSWAEDDMVINEFLSASALGTNDWIELYNRGSAPVDLLGWYLSDDPGNLTMWRISNSVVAAGDTAVSFTGNDFGFGLAQGSDVIVLTRPDGETVASIVEYADQWPDRSRGRWPNGSTTWASYSHGSPGITNAAPAVDSIVITEIMYHPVSELGGEEYIELYNAGVSPVGLFGCEFTDGIAYVFPPGAFISPDQHLVIGNDPAAVAAKYGISGVLGPFVASKLSNRGEQIELCDAYGNVLDSVYYQDRGEWPRIADGQGPSLELLSPLLDNGLPGSWHANNETTAQGTPGESNSIVSSASCAVLTAGHYPVAPDSSEDVVVMARVTGDPVSVMLSWKEDADSTFNALAMSEDGSGNQVYSAIIPAQADTDLIEYYVTAQDGSGGSADLPFGAPSFHLVGTGHDVPNTFRYIVIDDPGEPSLPTFRLIMPAETRAELGSRNLYSDELIPVTMTYLGEVFQFARIRYRGTVKRQWTVKSYRVDLRCDHPFAGENRLNMNGRRPGPEWLATEYFRLRGFAVPLLQNIQVRINERNEGPYLLAERIGNDYLERNYPGADNGEWHEMWGQDLVAPEVYPSNVQARLTTVYETNRYDYAEVAGGAVDVDKWIEWLTVTEILGDWQTLLNGVEANHACYIHPHTGLLQIEPLDLDAAWEIPSMQTHITAPVWYFDLTALDRFMRYPCHSRAYYQSIVEELDRHFVGSVLSNHINGYFNVVGPTEQSTAAQCLSYLSGRSDYLETAVSNLVYEASDLQPRVESGSDGGVCYWPHASGWIDGKVVKGTHWVLADGGTNAVTLDPEKGAWRYEAVLQTGDTALVLSSVPLTNRAYQTSNRVVVLRYDTGDDDGDGLHNSWELFYGLDPDDDGMINTNNGAAGDPDCDGISNADELSGRTDPVRHGNYQAGFGFDTFHCKTGKTTYYWDALPGAGYRIQATDNLADSAWTNIGSICTALTGRVSTTITNSGSASFFRIRLVEWPE